MNRVGINGRLVLVMTILTIVEGTVSFWRNNVILTCPKEGEFLWENATTFLSDTLSYTVTSYEANQKYEYQCKWRDEESNYVFYRFLFKGKGCENCYEVDTYLVVGCIIGDLMFTGGFILIVYLWAQKRSGLAAPEKSTSHSASRAPAVPHPDYEPLRPGNRSKDIYATHRNG
ncbi:hypothetical protein DPEC_G00298120 [Dallia pectoralis]|uniref:Uncharacterized protein n=1 Tax=Dallia pectoralis TaxID=75939 RepID=A0ACC2FFZ4_DALPE|nr:hypothetical protein DPEC_G00298120 [Dallia pectoralis]